MIQFTGHGQKRQLREREKRARRARIFEGLAVGFSFREIAAREGLTERRIRQIVAEARQDRRHDDEALRATIGTQGFPALLRCAKMLAADGDAATLRFIATLVDRIDRLFPAADAS